MNYPTSPNKWGKDLGDGSINQGLSLFPALPRLTYSLHYTPIKAEVLIFCLIEDESPPDTGALAEDNTNVLDHTGT